jgi:transcriptional regulator with XRE-family HTH domain
MIISERIFELLKERGMSQREFSIRTDISQSAISDWKRKKTNPTLEKVIPLCEALDISPMFLLTGEDGPSGYVITQPKENNGLREDEQLVVEYYNSMSEVKKKRLIAYMKGLSKRK